MYLLGRERTLFRARTFVCQVNHSVYNVPGFLRRIGVFAFATAFRDVFIVRCASSCFFSMISTNMNSPMYTLPLLIIYFNLYVYFMNYSVYFFGDSF